MEENAIEALKKLNGNMALLLCLFVIGPFWYGVNLIVELMV